MSEYVTEVTVGNVDETNVHWYIEGIDCRSGIKGYSVRFGLGVWEGKLERSATFTYVGDHRASFEQAISEEARYRGEEYVMVEYSERVVKFAHVRG